MAQKGLITITSDASSAALAEDLVSSSSSQSTVAKLRRYLAACISGTDACSLKVERSMAQASATITFSDVGQAADTILINGVTFTAVAAGATGNQWNVGASATASAAALAAAINASATDLVNKHVTAEAVSGVITLTAVVPGHAGNAITCAEGVDALSHMAVSAARLSGGTSTSSSFALHR